MVPFSVMPDLSVDRSEGSRAMGARMAARQRKHEAHGDGHADEGGAAIGDEGKSHSLGRQQGHVHTHVDDGLEAEDERQAAEGQGREGIGLRLGTRQDA